MYRLISVVGNIASGKSSFLAEIKKLSTFKDYNFISIDQCRLQSAETTTSKDPLEIENRAWYLFKSAIMNAIKKDKNIFIESSGLSWRMKAMYDYFKSKELDYYIVKLTSHRGVARTRIHTRKTPVIPYPYDGDQMQAWDSMSGPISNLPCDLELVTDECPANWLAKVFTDRFTLAQRTQRAVEKATN